MQSVIVEKGLIVIMNADAQFMTDFENKNELIPNSTWPRYQDTNYSAMLQFPECLKTNNETVTLLPLGGYKITSNRFGEKRIHYLYDEFEHVLIIQE